MKKYFYNTAYCTLMSIIFIMFSNTANAQWMRTPTPNDTLTSYKILPANKINFKVYAPEAKKVNLDAVDIIDMSQVIDMEKMENGVWQTTVGPLTPGPYRYAFNIDGIRVVDPKNPLTSQANMNAWSLFHMPGSLFMDTKDVPHGAVSEIVYSSTSLKKFRRMHVYTPPGYQAGNESYPVFYLLHGAFDNDDSWSSVGRAGFIMDNLIAAKKAKKMIVVMPFGHTGPYQFGQQLREDDFINDFNNDIMPYVEKHYRTKMERSRRAIAGLSMGGAHTLDIAIPHLDKFAWIGVFSSGIFGITGGWGGEPSKNKSRLTDEDLKEDLKLVWFATGRDDFMYSTSVATVDLLNKYKFNAQLKTTDGGHTWINWRNYLHEFAQLLFQD